jgi:hypothetical protein
MYITANAGCSNFRFLKSNCLNNVTPKMIATTNKVNEIDFLFSIFLMFYKYVNYIPFTIISLNQFKSDVNLLKMIDLFLANIRNNIKNTFLRGILILQ